MLQRSPPGGAKHRLTTAAAAVKSGVIGPTYVRVHPPFKVALMGEGEKMVAGLTYRSNCCGVSGGVSEDGLAMETKSSSSTPGTRSVRPILKNPSVSPLFPERGGGAAEKIERGGRLTERAGVVAGEGCGGETRGIVVYLQHCARREGGIRRSGRWLASA